VLTLVLLPALYYLIEDRVARRAGPDGKVTLDAMEGERMMKKLFPLRQLWPRCWLHHWPPR
jgi:hypothetical protein